MFTRKHRLKQAGYGLLSVALIIGGLSNIPNASAVSTCTVTSVDGGDGYTYVSFKSPDGTTCTTSWSTPTGVSLVDYLVVGGGGGGASRHAGGGGASGLRNGKTAVSGSVSIQVGKGGDGTVS